MYAKSPTGIRACLNFQKLFRGGTLENTLAYRDRPLANDKYHISVKQPSVSLSYKLFPTNLTLTT